MPGTHNPNRVLTEYEKSIAVVTVLTDGWIEKSKAKKVKTARIGLQLTVKNMPLLNFWLNIFKDLIFNPTIKTRLKRSKNGQKYLQGIIRTSYHPEFYFLFVEFGGQGAKKTIPSLATLERYLTWESFAVILMMDGSIHNAGGGIEIHTQQYSKKAQDRLCVALYKKLGLYAWPSYYGCSKAGVKQFHIQISSYCLPRIRRKALQHMLPTSQYKIPALVPHVYRAHNFKIIPWHAFYKAHKNVLWLQDITIP